MTPARMVVERLDPERITGAHEPPRLVEYGSITKLTQGSNTFLNEGGGMRFMFPCL